jgi:predicted glycogen debranching enzyme
MEHILFTKNDLSNLEYSLNREVLRANISNAYSCTTLPFCNTRKYHGLLIVPQPKIDNQNHVLLSSLDETIKQNNQSFNLALHRYQEGVYSPKGHKYLESYELGVLPTHTYRIGSIVLVKQMFFQEKQDRLLIKYTLKEALEEIELELQPFLAFRQVHKLSKSNQEADTSSYQAEQGRCYKMYKNYTPLYIQFSKKISYEHNPYWYYNFEYIKEKERGYDYMEDLLVPGTFKTTLRKGESVYVSCGVEEANPFLLSQDFTKESHWRFPIETTEDVLQRAARMFFARKGTKVNLVAGFPWFGRWGRDTFISLPGLCIALNDWRLFRLAIDTMLDDFKDGFFPNIGEGKQAAYNSVDAPLWFFWTLQQYAYINDARKEVWQAYSHIMRNILENFSEGVSNVRMDSNFLLWQGEEGKALTWMDAIIDGNPVTARKGYAVEINALWYNAVMFYRELAKLQCEDGEIAKWDEFAENFPTNFKATFWSKEIGYLADYVDGAYKDFSVRCNMIFAASLEYSPISPKIRQLIVEKVKQELLTPRGLRSLSPTHKDYHEIYFGNQQERDRAYHNGTVWPWLIGAFSEAFLRVYGKEAVNYIEQIYNEFGNILCDYCVGSIAEVYDGNPPYKAGGSISQAWSVAEVCRMKYMIDKCKQFNDSQL